MVNPDWIRCVIEFTLLYRVPKVNGRLGNRHRKTSELQNCIMSCLFLNWDVDWASRLITGVAIEKPRFYPSPLFVGAMIQRLTSIRNLQTKS